MTQRQQAIAKAKEAYRFFLTHGIKPDDMPMSYQDQLVVFWSQEWTIVLNGNGSLASATQEQAKLTEAQVAWAKGHDWFHSDCGDGTIWIVDRYTQHGRSFQELVHFQGNIKALRDWAGY